MIKSVVGSLITWKDVKTVDDVIQQLINNHSPHLRGPYQFLCGETGSTHHLTQTTLSLILANNWGPKGFLLGFQNDSQLEASLDVLSDKAEPENHNYEWDLIVIGGGSGGLSVAKNAAKCGKKVAMLDFVKPSPQGTTWGLGGTCVNVGCIPKKLMHQASLLGEAMKDSHSFGWTQVVAENQSNNNNNNNNNKVRGVEADVDILGTKKKNNLLMSSTSEDVVMKDKFDSVVDDDNDDNDDNDATTTNKLNWETLVNNIQDHIGSLNWGYTTEMQDANVKYINSYGSFIDPHTIEAIDRKKRKSTMTSRRFVIAVGGRPNPLGIPGEEFAISSDDLFSLSRSPGDTLVIGASYIALECAGFLTGLGFKTTVMVRSILLRGFDQDMAEKINESMAEVGVKFIRPAFPTKIEKLTDEAGNEKFKVFWKENNNSIEKSALFDTVLAAVGRHPVTEGLNLEKAGVKINPKSGKIDCVNERTNVPHIYAVGDVVEGYPELTPVAIKAGKLLALRLYDKSTHFMDYINIPTVVFTPVEYGTVGLSEETAIAKYGENDVDVYHQYFKPLEMTIVHERENPNPCYIKVICRVSENDRVIGFHIISPNAGEITQGFALAMKAGLYRSHLIDTVGIHPTIAEEFTTLTITKRSGIDAKKKGC